MFQYFQTISTFAIENLQSYDSSLMTYLMLLFSFAGSEIFYLILIPMIYWAVSPKFALRFLSLLILTVFVNSMLKLLFHEPRPFWLDPTLSKGHTPTGYGFPSGHSQNALTLWLFTGLTANILKGSYGRILQTALALLFIFLISLSRIYLGVHFLHDVVFGWMIGLILLGLYFVLEKRVIPFYRQRNSLSLVLDTLVLSFFMIALYLLVGDLLKNTTDPAFWIVNIHSADHHAVHEPRSVKDIITLAGILSGMGVALPFAWTYFQRLNRTISQDTIRRRSYRFLAGILGVVLIQFGIGAVFTLLLSALPFESAILEGSLRFIRYSAIMIWALALAPIVFERLGLLDGEDQR